MKKYFGTDGIRGKANVHPMTPELALRLGQVLALHFGKDHPEPRIVIGKDPRRSSYIFEFALAAGACSMGASTYQLGPLPTPAVAFLTRSMRAQAGVMVSASHNPFQDNGIKIFGADGFKLPDEVEGRLEALIDSDEADKNRPVGKRLGRAYRIEDALGRYIVSAKDSFPLDLSLRGLKIVVDCANGAAYRAAPAVFEELGAEVIQLGTFPDGTNINRRCGALYPEQMARTVVREEADLGVALDGDADRLILADEKGEIVDGDAVMGLVAEMFIKEGRLHDNTVVATVMSNMGLDKYLRRLGGKLLRTAVGDRYVIEAMRRGGLNFGGEQSGHMIFLDHSTTGDGLVSSLQVMAVMLRTGKKLSELVGRFERFPQILEAVEVAAKPAMEDVPQLAAAVKAAEKRLGDNGRVLVRFSGTENVLRIMVEAEDGALARAETDKILEAAHSAPELH
jgi:phosphoglucosamine mutase